MNREATFTIMSSSVPWIDPVFVDAFLFPSCSLCRETTLVRAFSCGHRFGEVSIECGTNFLEPNLVRFHLLLWTDRERLHALQYANQAVHIAIPQINFGVNVQFQRSRFLSPTVRSKFRPFCSWRVAVRA